ncbi:MAG TPA: DUF1549 domain-containing protein, partial [Isosphaeraceae bacterium]|nr:DUF1549 domain-containing protein [Isosphaeraceae bacterium]
MSRCRGFCLVLTSALAAFAIGTGQGIADEPAVAPTLDPAINRGASRWAFQPVRRPEVPRLDAGAGVRNPIDAFVRKAQHELGIVPGVEADRVTLIRRLSLDLTGLPPSPGDVDAFLSDERPDAYERLVDRLLAAPAYGERWGRFWLDLARYADSAGFEEDTKRPDAWRYRDWVVDALNADIPFDRFVALQLAADELAADEPRHKAALGFLRNGAAVGNQRSEKIRMDELDDVVSTTSSVFLGLTVACARCHDHKFDPIPMEDYYRLVAVFAPARFADVPLVTTAEEEQHRKASQNVDEQAEVFRAAILAIERSARERLEAENRAAFPEAWRKALASGDLAALTKDEQDDLAQRVNVRPEDLDEALSALDRSVRDELRARVAVVEARRPQPLPMAPGVVESGSKAAPVPLLFRGDVARKGQAMRPGPLRAVEGRVVDFAAAKPGATSTGRRSALATWIVSERNPVTARVQVNRLWQGHFGEGLVPTPSDFGSMGEKPALPELLDWLAAEFLASGWSQKALHRLIVTSATYRQSSRIRSEAQEADPENALCWRYPVRRLDAETIRDAILWCAGSLNLQRGGPGVFPPIDPSVIRTGNIPRWPLDAQEGPDVWRRSLYLFRMRSVPIPLLEVFDLP